MNESDEHKQQINTIFENLVMYTSLLDFGVNQLTDKEGAIKDYRETLKSNQYIANTDDK